MLHNTAREFSKRPDAKVIDRVALLLACGVKEGTSKQQHHALEHLADAVLKDMGCSSLAPRAGAGTFSKSDLGFLLVAGSWALKNPNKAPASFSGVMSKIRSGWACRSAGKVTGLSPLIFRRLKKGYAEISEAEFGKRSEIQGRHFIYIITEMLRDKGWNIGRLSLEEVAYICLCSLFASTGARVGEAAPAAKDASKIPRLSHFTWGEADGKVHPSKKQVVKQLTKAPEVGYLTWAVKNSKKRDFTGDKRLTIGSSTLALAQPIFWLTVLLRKRITAGEVWGGWSPAIVTKVENDYGVPVTYPQWAAFIRGWSSRLSESFGQDFSNIKPNGGRHGFASRVQTLLAQQPGLGPAWFTGSVLGHRSPVVTARYTGAPPQITAGIQAVLLFEEFKALCGFLGDKWAKSIPGWLCKPFKGIKPPKGVVDLEQVFEVRDSQTPAGKESQPPGTQVRPDATLPQAQGQSAKVMAKSKAEAEGGIPLQAQSRTLRPNTRSSKKRRFGGSPVAKEPSEPVTPSKTTAEASPTVRRQRPQRRTTRPDYRSWGTDGTTSREVLVAIRKDTEQWFANAEHRVEPDDSGSPQFSFFLCAGQAGIGHSQVKKKKKKER